MVKSRLNDLQHDFLREFFSRETGFYLTGGAALAGFYLGHRETEDLDLFTREDEVEAGFGVVRDVATSLNASIESIITSPDFRRVLITRGDEGVVVDLAREDVFQLDSVKREINGIRVDSPEEILANKLCALLARAETRDLIDVRALEKAGLSVRDAAHAAAKKDMGFSPAQLGWVLNQIKFGDDVQLPSDISVEEMRSYLNDLIGRLKRLAFPVSDGE